MIHTSARKGGESNEDTDDSACDSFRTQCVR